MSAAFVADVGGTNIRLCRVEQGQLKEIKKYLCADFEHISDAIKHYFATLPEVNFSSGCIAIACPTENDWIKMTNHHWQFSVKETQALLELDYLSVINDYTAISMSLPVLDSHQKVQIGGGTCSEQSVKAVFGPGTGLGVGALIPDGDQWSCLDGEGGHVDFSPIDEKDLVIWRYLTDKCGHASAEEVLSGRGLVNIYQALASNEGMSPVLTEPSQITEQALDQSCGICVKSLKQFCRIMGSFAGNLALTTGAYGGVYIAGGIVPRFVKYFQQSEFRTRFEAKGRFRQYVAAIPTYVITEPDHGLLGAAAYLKQDCKGSE